MGLTELRVGHHHHHFWCVQTHIKMTKVQFVNNNNKKRHFLETEEKPTQSLMQVLIHVLVRHVKRYTFGTAYPSISTWHTEVVTDSKHEPSSQSALYTIVFCDDPQNYLVTIKMRGNAMYCIIKTQGHSKWLAKRLKSCLQIPWE